VSFTNLTNVSISNDTGLVEATATSDTNRDYQGTIVSGQITVSGFFDDTSVGATAGQDYNVHLMMENAELLNFKITMGASRYYQNTGYSTGSPSTANGCRIVSYELSGDVGGLMAFSMVLQTHGLFERG
jgi:hypothetical protein